MKIFMKIFTRQCNDDANNFIYSRFISHREEGRARGRERKKKSLTSALTDTLITHLFILLLFNKHLRMVVFKISFRFLMSKDVEMINFILPSFRIA